MNHTCKEACFPVTVLYNIMSLRTTVGQLDSNMQAHFENSFAEPKFSGTKLWPSGSSLERPCRGQFRSTFITKVFMEDSHFQVQLL